MASLLPGVTEGFTLVSATTTGPIGGGTLVGIVPDAATYLFVVQPIAAGDPAHWSTGTPGVWPAVPFVVPAPTLSVLAGQHWDMVIVGFGPGYNLLQTSNVQRLNW